MLKAGDRVPEFALESEILGNFSSADLRGKRYVMYFYPKDDTPGCTKEACSFRDHHPRFEQIKVPVFGVSADDEKSHIRFARKYGLNFRLIPDTEHKLLTAFGTWVEKSMYGKNYWGVSRSTFVVDAKGVVEKVWEKVSPEGHADEVMAYLGGSTVAKTKSAAAAQALAAARAKAPKKAAATSTGAKSAPKASAKPKAVKPAKVVKAAKPAKPANKKPAAKARSVLRKPAAAARKKAAGAKKRR
jgi:peroxiredoxin Q/BCP